ncbi:MAG: bifunctional phosphoserine phosphatase/homoserine phosphotransferase ThrH [Candidatus Thorarchaeota archaeon]
MYVACFDLEGVFTPEVWIAISKATNINELRLTTRDISDYDLLMKNRIKILKKNKISLKQIQNIISDMDILPGAKEFLDFIRRKVQTIIVTDSFTEFISPFMEKLNYPLCFCHNLETDKEGMITNYNIRIQEMKRKTIQSLKQLNFEVIVTGDSYNDLPMLFEAKYGILFKPPHKVTEDYPQFPVVTEYSELKHLILTYLDSSSLKK